LCRSDRRDNFRRAQDGSNPRETLETLEDLMASLGECAELEALRGPLVAVEQQESASLVGELAPEFTPLILALVRDY
jgi:hypothetical protein